MKCLYCEENEAIKYSRYANGNFCSKLCARRYSANFNRKETNEKISKSMKLVKPAGYYECKNKKCKNMVLGRKNPYCSENCKNIHSIEYRKDPEYIKKLSRARIKAILEGKTNFKSTKCEYKFKNKIIKCDSKIEYSCLNYFETHYDILNIQRNKIVIPYEFEKRPKLFLPDFKIVMKDGSIFLIEAKSDIVTSKLNKKWHFYKETSIIKEQVLIKYCEENNLIPFWYIKKMNLKFYNSLKF